MSQDFFSWVIQGINDLLQQNMGFFVGMGQNLFRGFATILVAWFGVKAALSSAGRGTGFQFSNFASLLLTISFGFGMINYYDNPIPGFGIGFHKLITDEATFLTQQITTGQLQVIIDKITLFEANMESPGLGIGLGTVVYVVIIILLAAAQAIAFVVVAFGLIATAVCVLVGPVFIPFFIVPKLEWLFWGWIKCFIQYAFYQVVAAGVVFVIGNLITSFLGQWPGPISIDRLIGLFPALFITFLASIYALLKIPALTNSIFSGSSGQSSGGILESLLP
jgi:type IV secretory pathway VirB6-like protein